MVCPLCSVNEREIELTNLYFNASDQVLHLYVSLHSFQQEKLLSYAEEVAKLILSNVLLLLSNLSIQIPGISLCCCLVKSERTALLLDVLP